MPPLPPSEATPDLLPHEIAGPVGYLPYPWPIMIGAGLLLLILLSLVGWALLAWRQRVKRRPPTARQIALDNLMRARAGAAQVGCYPFSIEVCHALRVFLGAEYALPATTQTSYEFLQTARGSKVFDAAGLTRRTDFLAKVDAVKFAQAEASATDNLELVSLAEELVKGGVPDVVAS